MDGPKFVFIACNHFEGTTIIGNEVSNTANFSITITLYSNTESDISVTLITELSYCHPGSHYDDATQRCVCYNSSDTVSCSGSTSVIKRGYWYGLVNNKSTVS